MFFMRLKNKLKLLSLLIFTFCIHFQVSSQSDTVSLNSLAINIQPLLSSVLNGGNTVSTSIKYGWLNADKTRFQEISIDPTISLTKAKDDIDNTDDSNTQLGIGCSYFYGFILKSQKRLWLASGPRVSLSYAQFNNTSNEFEQKSIGWNAGIGYQLDFGIKLNRKLLIKSSIALVFNHSSTSSKITFMDDEISSNSTSQFRLQWVGPSNIDLVYFF